MSINGDFAALVKVQESSSHRGRNQHSSTSAAPIPETRYVALEEWLLAVSEAQKLESQTTLKLPWDGVTTGQELGLLVSSNWGPNPR
jgi:hypothetical protein